MGLSITERAASIENEEICWGDFPVRLMNDSYKKMIQQEEVEIHDTETANN
jgi:hypothetical protein